MNRSEAVQLMASRAHITKEQADKALTALLDGISESLRENGKATLAEFELAAGEKPSEALRPEEKQRIGADENDDKGPWERIWELAGSVSGPPDWAENHHEYLRRAREPHQ